jgi:hypothetical protein
LAEVLIAVHHSGDLDASTLIKGATQAALPGGWVLGPKWPATHAFVIVLDRDEKTGERKDWRLDGEPPHATRSGWRISPPFSKPVVAWGFPKLSPEQQAVGVEAALALVGTPYDMGEIATQAMAAAARMASFVPFGPRKVLSNLSRMIGRADAFHDAAICTRIATKVMQRMGFDTDALDDLFPERLAQWLRRGEGIWTERRVFWTSDPSQKVLPRV